MSDVQPRRNPVMDLSLPRVRLGQDSSWELQGYRVGLNYGGGTGDRTFLTESFGVELGTGVFADTDDDYLNVRDMITVPLQLNVHQLFPVSDRTVCKSGDKVVDCGGTYDRFSSYSVRDCSKYPAELGIGVEGGISFGISWLNAKVTADIGGTIPLNKHGEAGGYFGVGPTLSLFSFAEIGYRYYLRFSGDGETGKNHMLYGGINLLSPLFIPMHKVN